MSVSGVLSSSIDVDQMSATAAVAACNLGADEQHIQSDDRSGVSAVDSSDVAARRADSSDVNKMNDSGSVLRADDEESLGGEDTAVAAAADAAAAAGDDGGGSDGGGSETAAAVDSVRVSRRTRPLIIDSDSDSDADDKPGQHTLSQDAVSPKALVADVAAASGVADGVRSCSPSSPNSSGTATCSAVGAAAAAPALRSYQRQRRRLVINDSSDESDMDEPSAAAADAGGGAADASVVVVTTDRAHHQHRHSRPDKCSANDSQLSPPPADVTLASGENKTTTATNCSSDSDSCSSADDRADKVSQCSADSDTAQSAQLAATQSADKQQQRRRRTGTGTGAGAEADVMAQVRSESQRRLRESRLNLPYHRPRQQPSLRQFLARKQQLLPQQLHQLPLYNGRPVLRLGGGDEQQLVQLCSERERAIEQLYRSQDDELTDTAGSSEQDQRQRQQHEEEEQQKTEDQSDERQGHDSGGGGGGVAAVLSTKNVRQLCSELSISSNNNTVPANASSSFLCQSQLPNAATAAGGGGGGDAAAAATEAVPRNGASTSQQLVSSAQLAPCAARVEQWLHTVAAADCTGQLPLPPAPPPSPPPLLRQQTTTAAGWAQLGTAVQPNGTAGADIGDGTRCHSSPATKPGQCIGKTITTSVAKQHQVAALNGVDGNGDGAVASVAAARPAAPLCRRLAALRTDLLSVTPKLSCAGDDEVIDLDDDDNDDDDDGGGEDGVTDKSGQRATNTGVSRFIERYVRHSTATAKAAAASGAAGGTPRCVSVPTLQLARDAAGNTRAVADTIQVTLDPTDSPAAVAAATAVADRDTPGAQRQVLRSQLLANIRERRAAALRERAEEQQRRRAAEQSTCCDDLPSEEDMLTDEEYQDDDDEEGQGSSAESEPEEQEEEMERVGGKVRARSAFVDDEADVSDNGDTADYADTAVDDHHLTDDCGGGGGGDDDDDLDDLPDLHVEFDSDADKLAAAEDGVQLDDGAADRGVSLYLDEEEEVQAPLARLPTGETVCSSAEQFSAQDRPAVAVRAGESGDDSLAATQPFSQLSSFSLSQLDGGGDARLSAGVQPSSAPEQLKQQQLLQSDSLGVCRQPSRSPDHQTCDSDFNLHLEPLRLSQSPPPPVQPRSPPLPRFGGHDGAPACSGPPSPLGRYSAIGALLDPDPSQESAEDLLSLCSGKFGSVASAQSQAGRQPPSLMRWGFTNRQLQSAGAGAGSASGAGATGRSAAASAAAADDDDDDDPDSVRCRTPSSIAALLLDDGNANMPLESPLPGRWTVAGQRLAACASGAPDSDSGDSLAAGSSRAALLPAARRKRRRQHKRLVFSDDEDDASGADRGEVGDISDANHDDDDDSDDDGGDGRANRLDTALKTNFSQILQDPSQRLAAPKGFFDDEAELSGSEAPSDDEEDGEHLDEMEEEMADLEKLDEKKIREQVERMHYKKALDDDLHELKLFQQRFLEDGDMHGPGRQKKFRWNMQDEADGGELDARNSAEEENGDEDAIECEERWRLERHERNKWLQQHETAQLEDDADVSCHDNGDLYPNHIGATANNNNNNSGSSSCKPIKCQSSLFVKPDTVRLARVKTSAATTITTAAAATEVAVVVEQSTVAHPGGGLVNCSEAVPRKCVRGSFLSRDQRTLSRLASAIRVPAAVAGSGGLGATSQPRRAAAGARESTKRTFSMLRASTDEGGCDVTESRAPVVTSQLNNVTSAKKAKSCAAARAAAGVTSKKIKLDTRSFCRSQTDSLFKYIS